MDLIIGMYLGGLAVGVIVEILIARKLKTMKDIFGRPIGFRHWLAWQVTKVAHLIYPGGEYPTKLIVTDGTGIPRLEIGLRSTVWGGGLAWIDTSRMPVTWSWEEVADV